MKNLACGDHWILNVVTWSVLRKVTNEDLVTDRWFHVCPYLVSSGEVEEITALLESLFVCC